MTVKVSSETSRRLKYGAILLAVIASALVLTASTQTWYTLHLTATSGHAGTLTVAGSAAAPAVAALSLAGVAFGAALALAGRILRYVLAVLGLVLSASIIGSTASAIGDPIGSGITVVTNATGVAGDASVRAIIARADATAWPALALAGGIALLLATVLVVATGHLWPVSSRRYGATEDASSDKHAEPSDDDDEHLSAADQRARARDAAIGDWDELSRGDDPTAAESDDDA
ncbi:Trp biosynthesis-associated membrane protein [Humibacter ginsenosidimutans]|uniref:Trp biosynthesis-associated membrane protein n=1 Tax=Humibacter ginsenosidimutans TaxID=2599293 RepID=UPI00143DB909|nr:Trp biosynthesis-associated membrane protein [Humibacter ginsenosidimutans]